MFNFACFEKCLYGNDVACRRRNKQEENSIFRERRENNRSLDCREFGCKYFFVPPLSMFFPIRESLDPRGSPSRRLRGATGARSRRLDLPCRSSPSNYFRSLLETVYINRFSSSSNNFLLNPLQELSNNLLLCSFHLSYTQYYFYFSFFFFQLSPCKWLSFLRNQKQESKFSVQESKYKRLSPFTRRFSIYCCHSARNFERQGSVDLCQSLFSSPSAEHAKEFALIDS